MADQRVTALANERARERRAVADVNLHLFQRRLVVVDEEEIRPVKNKGTPRANAVSHGRSQDRVLNRKSFERDSANLGRRAFLDQLAIVDLAAL